MNNKVLLEIKDILNQLIIAKFHNELNETNYNLNDNLILLLKVLYSLIEKKPKQLNIYYELEFKIRILFDIDWSIDLDQNNKDTYEINAINQLLEDFKYILSKIDANKNKEKQDLIHVIDVSKRNKTTSTSSNILALTKIENNIKSFNNKYSSRIFRSINFNLFNSIIMFLISAFVMMSSIALSIINLNLMPIFTFLAIFVILIMIFSFNNILVSKQNFWNESFVLYSEKKRLLVSSRKILWLYFIFLLILTIIFIYLIHNQNWNINDNIYLPFIFSICFISSILVLFIIFILSNFILSKIVKFDYHLINNEYSHYLNLYNKVVKELNN